MSNLSGHGQLTGVMRSGGGGGGGSEVIINPSGAAIGTMEKISVDGDIYEVRNVPDATSASNGDVLTRTASGFGWYPPTEELPTYTSSDNNKVLTVDDETLTWKTIPKELPNILSSDEGKVLKVSNGAPTWQDESGGGSEIITYTRTITTNDYGWWFVEDKNNQPLYVDNYTLLSVNCIVDNSSGTWRGIGVESFVDINQYRIRFQDINDGGFYRNSATYTIEVSYISKSTN